MKDYHFKGVGLSNNYCQPGLIEGGQDIESIVFDKPRLTVEDK
jgi:hypothetical protein